MRFDRWREGFSEEIKFDVNCCPGAGLTYPFGSGNKFRNAWPVGSILGPGIRLPGKHPGPPTLVHARPCAVSKGSAIGITAPRESRDCEKSPFRSSSVGSFTVVVRVGIFTR